jgi:histidinol-phosphate/aromatic aminotransferase/cobyric acid decarboxylase-like protein/N-acyl-L-homoserine lactone synthetase
MKRVGPTTCQTDSGHADSADGNSSGMSSVQLRSDHPTVVNRLEDSATWEVAQASDTDRAEISRLRHQVYASELHQHAENAQQELHDALDDYNVMLVVRRGGRITGFVSLTPPSAPRFSVDKYFQRDDLPFPFDSDLYEVRLLTVVQDNRLSETASLLLYAAFRWVDSHGGTRIVAIGRREVLPLYVRIGMERLGISATSGAVHYELLLGKIEVLRSRLEHFRPVVDRLKQRTQWKLSCEFDVPSVCFHGGAFFQSVGDEFDALHKVTQIINADVLDAWYPPAPSVIRVLQDYLPWLVRTSPPTLCEGLLRTIANVRGVPEPCLLPGAGSSDLIFRVFRQWLTRKSRVLILNPMYGEYAHVLKVVIGCQITSLRLNEEQQFAVPLEELVELSKRNFDLVVIVNPNSPTGRHVPWERLQDAIRQIPLLTRVWIDETYVDYAGPSQSLERFAATTDNVVVCKSMSKVYALSGLRVAYLCGARPLVESLRSRTPPWVTGTLAQAAAVMALKAPDYYRLRIDETHGLRATLAESLQAMGFQVTPGVANFLLCRLPPEMPSADQLIDSCRTLGLYLRNPGFSQRTGHDRWIRVAVKDAATNNRMLEILSTVLSAASHHHLRVGE